MGSILIFEQAVIFASSYHFYYFSLLCGTKATYLIHKDCNFLQMKKKSFK